MEWYLDFYLSPHSRAQELEQTLTESERTSAEQRKDIASYIGAPASLLVTFLHSQDPENSYIAMCSLRCFLLLHSSFRNNTVAEASAAQRPSDAHRSSCILHRPTAVSAIFKRCRALAATHPAGRASTHPACGRIRRGSVLARRGRLCFWCCGFCKRQSENRRPSALDCRGNELIKCLLVAYFYYNYHMLNAREVVPCILQQLSGAVGVQPLQQRFPRNNAAAAIAASQAYGNTTHGGKLTPWAQCR